MWCRSITGQTKWFERSFFASVFRNLNSNLICTLIWWVYLGLIMCSDGLLTNQDTTFSQTVTYKQTEHCGVAGGGGALLCCLSVLCLWLWAVGYGGNLALQKTKDKERKSLLSSLVMLFSLLDLSQLARAKDSNNAQTVDTHTNTGHMHRNKRELPVQNNRYKYSSLWEKEYKCRVHPCTEEQRPAQCFLFSEPDAEKTHSTASSPCPKNMTSYHKWDSVLTCFNWYIMDLLVEDICFMAHDFMYTC